MPQEPSEVREWRFRVRRDQWLTRVVAAEGMDEAFEIARRGGGFDLAEEPIDEIVEISEALDA